MIRADAAHRIMLARLNADRFVDRVEEVTFSGPAAAERNQEVRYITERAVFALIEGTVTMIEIAEGLDPAPNMALFIAQDSSRERTNRQDLRTAERIPFRGKQDLPDLLCNLPWSRP